jgi:signal transduction histidine kinase
MAGLGCGAPIKPAPGDDALDRLDRVKRTLQQAIDLKRRVIEELRPSILDNLGLFAALHWQLKRTWGNSAVVSTETYPDFEPQFDSHAAIALFRVAQEALSIAFNRASVIDGSHHRRDKGNFDEILDTNAEWRKTAETWR